MEIIDSHAHIYDEAFNLDRDQIINNCKEAGISKILMPNCDSQTIEAMFACEKKYPNICIPMMGLHPCYVKENFEEEIANIEAHLQQRKFIAIGEIGLDYHWDLTFKAQQHIAFHQQIEMAIQYNVPIVIHSRESTEDCIEIIKKYPRLRGVFHCFSGSLVQAQKIVAQGFYLGIGGVITYKKTNLTEIVQEIPIENLILETDAPYLSPVPFRGKRNEPSYTKIIAQTLADILTVDVESIAEISTNNCKKLFNL
jgi:TatD DNase family protein